MRLAKYVPRRERCRRVARMEQGQGGLSEAAACGVAGSVRWSVRRGGASLPVLQVRPGERGIAHRFTEVLPREESWKDACEPCQRDVEFHEGPHAAREVSVRRAWRRCGVGGCWCGFDLSGCGRRGRASGRGGCGSTRRARELRFSRHGSLVMDWVEVFAPVVSRRIARASGRRVDHCCWTTCRSGCATQIPAGSGSLSGVRRDGV